MREGRPKDVGVGADAVAGCRRLANHQQATGDPRRPAALLADASGESDLPIERPDHGLDVRDDGLHLDHEERGARCVPGENVDRAALAVPAEGDLDRDDPAQLVEQSDDLVDERRVRGIEQPIQALAVPPNANVEIGAQGGARCVDVGERNASKEAPLDPRVL